MRPGGPAAPVARRSLLCAFAASALAEAGPARAAPSDHGREPSPSDDLERLPQHERWLRRFPQPVLVADLIGRQMLDQSQGVLGWIEAVARTGDDRLVIAFARRRLLLFRGDVVAVPAEVAALLGPFVMILDLKADEIATLPRFSGTGTSPVDRRSKILMALTKH